MLPIIIIMVLATATVILLAVGLMMKSERQLLLDRVHRYGFEEPSQAPALAEDLLPSFTERVMRPALRKIGRIGGGMRPGQAAENLKRMLDEAGNPMGLSPSEFSAIKALGLLIGLVFGLIFVLLAKVGGIKAALAVFLICFLGYYFPILYLNRKIAWRKDEIARALPNAIDLLNVSVEAGLGFDGAIARIVEKSSGPLADEFARALREMRMGRTRIEALRDMATRAGVPALRGFVAAIYQAEELGASLTTVLRVQGQMIRNVRRNRAREIAAKIPVKMLFPLVFFIFPSIFVVILGPGVIQLMHSLLFK